MSELVDLNASDNVGSGGQEIRDPISSINFASDETVRRWVQENVVEVVTYARQDRLPLEQEWRDIQNMILLKHDDNQRYIGRSNAYMPAYASARENLIAQFSQALFPSEEYMDVKARNEGKLEEARPVKQYIQWEFEKQARMRTHIKEFIGQAIDYGLTVAKLTYEKNVNRKSVSIKSKKGVVGPALSINTLNEANEGMRFLIRNIFYWYVWPTTAPSVDAASLVFEDIDVGLRDIEAIGRRNNWEHFEEVRKLFATTEPLHDTSVMAQQTAVMGTPSTPRTSTVTGSKISQWPTLTECWLDMPLPRSGLLDGESEGQWVPCVVTLCSGYILDVRRNPFWHQKKPFLVYRDTTFPGSFYSKGAGYRARGPQYLVNDFSNQLNDNGTFALNPMVKVDPNKLAAPLSPFFPGAVFQTTDPDKGIVFDRPPVEQLQHGLMLVNRYENAVDDNVGAPPVMQGQKQGGTATGTQILQNNASIPIKDKVEDIEAGVMQPAMEMAWQNAQQYRSQKVMDTIAGTEFNFDIEEFFGEYQFRFLASSQASNSSQRAQQAMTLLQTLTPPLVQQLAQAGWQVDPAPLVRRIYSDGFGFRDVESFLKKLVPPGQAALPPGQPQDNEQGQGEPVMDMGSQPDLTGNSGDSAIPGSFDPTEGEGQAFGDVRDAADATAGAMGAMR